MRSINMKLINLVSDMNQIDNILMTYVDLKGVHPILATEVVEKVRGLTSLISDNPYRAVLNEIENLCDEYHITLKDDEVKSKSCNINEAYDFIMSLKAQLDEKNLEIKLKEESIQKCEDVLIQIRHIHSLDIALDDLFECNFVFFRFGKIPNNSIDKIKLFSNKPFIFKAFEKEQYKTWCMYYTTNEYKREVDNIFSSLLFERVMIPDFVHGTPAVATGKLESEIADNQKMIENFHTKMDLLISENLEKINHIKGEFIFQERVFDFKKYVIGMGNKFSLLSFVKDAYVTEFMKSFEKFKDTEIVVKDAKSDARIQVPKRIKESFFSS
ncbi:MAG: hypothetical protein JXC31_01785 [Acholeplasmataceae bacterium]|nr:hypothetical protein [Acholeplasmataceae bacterium]